MLDSPKGPVLVESVDLHAVHGRAAHHVTGRVGKPSVGSAADLNEIAGGLFEVAAIEGGDAAQVGRKGLAGAGAHAADKVVGRSDLAAALRAGRAGIGAGLEKSVAFCRRQLSRGADGHREGGGARIVAAAPRTFPGGVVGHVGDLGAGIGLAEGAPA